MLSKYIKVISQSYLFAGIEENNLIPMLGCLQPRLYQYKKNDLITISGNSFDSLGIVLEGQAAVFKENASGDRTMMTLLYPNDMFGEVVLFSSNPVWPATVVAQDNCTILFVSQQKIIGQCGNMCQWHKLIIVNMLRLLSEKAIVLNKKLEYLSMKSIRGRISAFLLDQYKKAGAKTFTLPMKRNDLSEFLNIPRPSLSREMANMRDEGLIEFYLSTVKILDIEALKSMVE